MDRDKCLRDENQRAQSPVTVPQAQLFHLAKPEGTADPSHGCPCPVTGSCPLTSVTSRSWRTTSARSSQLCKRPVPHISTQCPRPACRTRPQQRSPCSNQFWENRQAQAGPGRSMWRLQLRVPGCRLPKEAQGQLFQQCCPRSHNSLVRCRIRPPCTPAATCCTPALGHAEPLSVCLKSNTSFQREGMWSKTWSLIYLCVQHCSHLCPPQLLCDCSQTCLIPSTPF